eukprot:TRINITY_DN19003_c0_g1_i1.p1 TRINITY_DN19003_c0_g1~~TRINITY_DN19003_c0_g1_i1.p1  ORF type:complete len:421 (+),score=37.75 TRINITY_DN19003_c0_g1_i1:299-1561(+)
MRSHLCARSPSLSWSPFSSSCPMCICTYLRSLTSQRRVNRGTGLTWISTVFCLSGCSRYPSYGRNGLQRIEPMLWGDNTSDFLSVRANLITYWNNCDSAVTGTACEVVHEQAPEDVNHTTSCQIKPVKLTRHCSIVATAPHGDGRLKYCNYTALPNSTWLRGALGEDTFTFLDIHVHDCDPQVCSWRTMERFWAMNNAGLAVDIEWFPRKPDWHALGTSATSRMGKVTQRVTENKDGMDPSLIFQYTEARVSGRSLLDDITGTEKNFSWLALYDTENQVYYCERSHWLCGAKYSARMMLFPETVQVYHVSYPTLTTGLAKVGGGAAALLAMMTVAVKVIVSKLSHHSSLCHRAASQESAQLKSERDDHEAEPSNESFGFVDEEDAGEDQEEVAAAAVSEGDRRSASRGNDTRNYLPQWEV